MQKKSNFNVPVYTSVMEEFDDWADTIAGKKGDKLAAALRAIQALHRIRPTLVSQLMQPEVSIETAQTLIHDTVVDLEIQGFLGKLTPKQRTEVLLAAKGYKDKPFPAEKVKK